MIMNQIVQIIQAARQTLPTYRNLQKNINVTSIER